MVGGGIWVAHRPLLSHLRRALLSTFKIRQSSLKTTHPLNPPGGGGRAQSNQLLRPKWLKINEWTLANASKHFWCLNAKKSMENGKYQKIPQNNIWSCYSRKIAHVCLIAGASEGDHFSIQGLEVNGFKVEESFLRRTVSVGGHMDMALREQHHPARRRLRTHRGWE